MIDVGQGRPTTCWVFTPSTNRVFEGLSGEILLTDPGEQEFQEPFRESPWLAEDFKDAGSGHHHCRAGAAGPGVVIPGGEVFALLRQEPEQVIVVDQSRGRSPRRRRRRPVGCFWGRPWAHWPVMPSSHRRVLSSPQTGHALRLPWSGRKRWLAPTPCGPSHLGSTKSKMSSGNSSSDNRLRDCRRLSLPSAGKTDPLPLGGAGPVRHAG